MQEQAKKPKLFGEDGGETVLKPKDLLAQVPDISAVLAPPKNKRTITRCGGCSNPNCRLQPVTVVVED